MIQTYFDILEGILSMFTNNSIALENSEKIIVIGKESGLAFFGALFALVFWLYIAIYNLNVFTIIVSAVIGLFTLFLFYQPKEIISELDLNKRKVSIRKTHFILNFSVEEIRFEDIERFEIEDKTIQRTPFSNTKLILRKKIDPDELKKVEKSAREETGELGAKLARYNLKIQSEEDLGRVSNSQEAEEKLNRFISLPG